MSEHMFDTLRILLALFKTNYELEIPFNLIYKEEIKKKNYNQNKNYSKNKKNVFTKDTNNIIIKKGCMFVYFQI